MLRVGSQHLHLIAALQLVAERHQFMVDLGADTVAAEERMYLESEVEHRTASRHGLHLTLRREDEDFGGEEVELDGVEEVHGIGLRVVENFLDGANPFVQLHILVGGAALLVFPVSGKALLRDVIHAVGAYLHLYPLTLLRHHRGVERLVAVRLRMVDPVTQTVGVALINLVERHVDLEAFVDLILPLLGGEDDAHGEDVVDFLEGDVLVLHLAPDGVGTLDASLDVVLEAHLVERLADGRGEVVKHLVALGLGHGQLLDDAVVFLGMLKLEAQVLELRLNLVEPQAVGNRRIDIERLAGYLILLVGRL